MSLLGCLGHCSCIVRESRFGRIRCFSGEVPVPLDVATGGLVKFVEPVGRSACMGAIAEACYSDHLRIRFRVEDGTEMLVSLVLASSSLEGRHMALAAASAALPISVSTGSSPVPLIP